MQRQLRDLSEFLYLCKSPKKLLKTKAASHSQEDSMTSSFRSVQNNLQVLQSTFRWALTLLPTSQLVRQI